MYESLEDFLRLQLHNKVEVSRECHKNLTKLYELYDFKTHFGPSLVKMYSMNVSKEFDDSWKLQSYLSQVL